MASLIRNRVRSILVVILLSWSISQFAQESKHSFRFSGQLSGWGSWTPSTDTKAWLGGRYLPQLNYGYTLNNGRLIDFEGAANIYGELEFGDPDVDATGKIKPYRFWARYSTAHSELRVGLQKINFGSAQIFRPLMWFDRMDPRDPLQMTDGVWGGLYRYYFQNNANVWLWALTGNKDPKGWEMFGTAGKLHPEAGGRLQLPFPSGETALSYHLRKADRQMLDMGKATEHRFGFDIRADVEVGLWLETSWTHYTKSAYGLTNQHMFTLGSDYTFGIGNGLGITAEHMLYSLTEKPFSLNNNINFTGVSLNYPLSIVDDISTMFYYDWSNSDLYTIITWQRQLNNISIYLMGFWNPETYGILGMSGSTRFAGKGLQLMVVWNH